MKSKKILSGLLAAGIFFGANLAANAPIPGTAAMAESDGYIISGNWEYRNIGDGAISVTNYLGESEYMFVPSEIDGLVVTEIATGAVPNGVTTIFIPESVKNISHSSLTSCSTLKTINAALNNRYFYSIDGVLYNKAITALLCVPSQNTNYYLTIPDTVTEIAPYAFYGVDSSGIIKIEMPKSVTSIGACAFMDCTVPNISYEGTKAEWDKIDISPESFVSEIGEIDYEYGYISDNTIIDSFKTEKIKYGLTLEKKNVDGEETVVLKLSGLPEEIFTYNYSYSRDYEYEVGDGGYYRREFTSFRITADLNEDSYLLIKTDDFDSDFLCGFVDKTKYWGYLNYYEPGDEGYDDEAYVTKMTYDGDTAAIEIYLESDSKTLSALKEMSQIKLDVRTNYSTAGGSHGAGFTGWGSICFSQSGIFDIYRGSVYSNVDVVNNLDGEPAAPEEPDEPSEPAEPSEPSKPSDPSVPSEPSEPSEPDASKPAEEQPAESDANTPDTANPNTGIALGIAPVLLAASAAAVVTKKKK